MVVSPKALYPLIVEDLSPHLSIDQHIAALFPGAVMPRYPDETKEQTTAISLLLNVFKKSVTDVEPDADDKALAKFISSNERCERWKISKEDWSLRDDLLWGTFLSVAHEVFSDPRIWFDDLTYLSKFGALGSGSNVHCPDTDLYSKLYGRRLSCSNPAIFELYQRYVAQCPRKMSAEFTRSLYYGHDVDVCDSKLSFVPKSNVISRTICTEPTLNMWYQRGYSSRFEEVLNSHFGIDLSIQPERNRRLCQVGSKLGTYCTIDLESASDSISLSLCKAILPKAVYNNLCMLRSPCTITPNGVVIKLHMVSSMGNGFTFSLQTLIFCCMVRAVYEVYDIAMRRPSPSRHPVWRTPSDHPGNFAVFGDDIIVRTEMYDPMCRLLNIAGFLVNSTKSFKEGPFRESCGCDFLSGHNIRPVFIKKLANLHDRFTVINLLRYWQSRHMIPLKRTLGFLLKSVPRVYVPRASPVESGLLAPFSVLGRPKLDRNGSYLYRQLRPKPVRYFLKGERIVGPRYLHRKVFNPDGLILFALYGGIRNGSFSVRSKNDAKYRFELAVSPSWDTLPLGESPLDSLAWARWDSESVSLFFGDLP